MGFAERARRELLATGDETPQIAPSRTAASSLSRRLRVAELAREGLSNLEIGRDCSSARATVEYHLGKVFTKLGINSRMQLHRALPPNPNGT